MKMKFPFLHSIRGMLQDKNGKTLLLFGAEGLLLQMVVSLYSLGNNLYATNLGATDTEIGLVQTIPNLVAMILMIPVGLLANRTRYSRTVPLVLTVFLSVAYFAYGTVPYFGEARMVAFFLFLGMTVGGVALYNAQWQTFFGAAVPMDHRNHVFTVRNRAMFFIGVLVPPLVGSTLALFPDTEAKLLTLQIFFYAVGVLMLLEALVIFRIPCPERAPEEKTEMGVAVFKEALRHMLFCKPFRQFFVCIMLFYIFWHCDWSLWYLAQVNYAGMNEAHLSIFQASCSIFQMFFIGYFAKLCRKKSEHFTIILASLGLMLCPLMVAIMLQLPMPARVPLFFGLGILGNIPQGAINMCVVTMVLQVTPVKNRALIISIYTLFVTASNSLLPLLGVNIYTALGGDAQALFLFCAVETIARGSVVVLMILRYRALKRKGDLFRNLAEPETSAT